MRIQLFTIFSFCFAVASAWAQQPALFVQGHGVSDDAFQETKHSLKKQWVPVAPSFTIQQRSLPSTSLVQLEKNAYSHYLQGQWSSALHFADQCAKTPPIDHHVVRCKLIQIAGLSKQNQKLPDNLAKFARSLIVDREMQIAWPPWFINVLHRQGAKRIPRHQTELRSDIQWQSLTSSAKKNGFVHLIQDHYLVDFFFGTHLTRVTWTEHINELSLPAESLTAIRTKGDRVILRGEMRTNSLFQTLRQLEPSRPIILVTPHEVFWNNQPIVPQSQDRSGRKVAGISLVALGGGLAAGGTVFYLKHRDAGIDPITQERIDGFNGKTPGIILGSAGVLSMGIGIYLWATSSDHSPRWTVSPSPHGATVSWNQSF